MTPDLARSRSSCSTISRKVQRQFASRERAGHTSGDFKMGIENRNASYDSTNRSEVESHELRQRLKSLRVCSINRVLPAFGDAL